MIVHRARGRTFTLSVAWSVLGTTDVNDTFEMGQNGLHPCRSGDAAAVATTTSASAAEQAIAISTLTRGTIGQVERVDKTSPETSVSAIEWCPNAPSRSFQG